jgi:hypothetical protein
VVRSELTDDEIQVESRLVAMEGAFGGHEGLRRWWDSFLGTFPDYTVEIEELRDLGDVTLAHIRGLGTWRWQRDADHRPVLAAASVAGRQVRVVALLLERGGSPRSRRAAAESDVAEDVEGVRELPQIIRERRAARPTWPPRMPQAPARDPRPRR